MRLLCGFSTALPQDYDAATDAAGPLDLTPSEAAGEAGRRQDLPHKASEANGLVRDVKAKVEALEAAALQAASSGQLKSDFEALAEKASRSDLEAVSSARRCWSSRRPRRRRRRRPDRRRCAFRPGERPCDLRGGVLEQQWKP